MPQFINTNVASLNTQRALNMSQTDLQTSLQRLSSGLRINSAKDDAAGLAISDRFTTQIRGLNQAIRNANDGVSLSQTAEGALTEVNNNLQRIRELAVQSANATNSQSDRAALDLEVQQRLAEVDRIASQTNFNGRKVLDGSFGNAAFQIGANVGETIDVSLATSMRTNAIGAVASATSVDLSTLVVPGTTGLTLGAGDLTIGGTDVASATYTTAAELATAINTAAGSSIATSSGNSVTLTNNTNAAITVAGAQAATIGLTTVAARTPTVDNNILAADFTDFSLSAGGLTVSHAGGGATAVAAGIYTATELAAAINTAYTTAGGTGTLATVSAGAVVLDETDAAGDGSQATVLAGTQVAALGIGGNLTLDDDGAAGDTATIAASVFDQFEVTDLTVDGAPVAIGAVNAAGLIGAINTAAGATIAASDGSGGINVTNDTASAIVFAGTDATTLGIGSVAAFTPGTDPSNDLSALLSNVNAATTFVVADNFSVQIGDGTATAVANATYTNQQDLVDAISTALGSNGSISLDTTTNIATITAGEDVTVTGSQGLAAFTSGAYTASGDLTTANVLTVAGSNAAVQAIDSALTSVSTLRSTFGAIQNRFESVTANLSTSVENLSASRSRIQDADFAAETAALTRNQILQQAGIAMLSQANAQPQNVLALLQ